MKREGETSSAQNINFSLTRTINEHWADDRQFDGLSVNILD